MTTHQTTQSESRPRRTVERGGPVLMTAAGLMELERELDQLRWHHRQEISEQLRDARSYGGGSNNDEYHALRESQMVVEARMALIENTVSRAVIVRPDEAANDAATIGSTIVLEDLASPGPNRRYRLASARSGHDDVISAASPMGQAVMGAGPGAVLTVELPNGNSRSVRVVAVERPEP
jgi:transcription elongation factor GreA